MGRKGGWYGESARHSQARKTGSAGGRSGKSNLNNEVVIDETGWQEEAKRSREHEAAMNKLEAEIAAEDKRLGKKYPPGTWRGYHPPPAQSDRPRKRK